MLLFRSNSSRSYIKYICLIFSAPLYPYFTIFTVKLQRCDRVYTISFSAGSAGYEGERCGEGEQPNESPTLRLKWVHLSQGEELPVLIALSSAVKLKRFDYRIFDLLHGRPRCEVFADTFCWNFEFFFLIWLFLLHN